MNVEAMKRPGVRRLPGARGMRMAALSLAFAAALAPALCIGAAGADGGRVFDIGREGVSISVEADSERVDVGRNFDVAVTVTSPPGKTAIVPDLRDRFAGFRVAEDFTEEPVEGSDGSRTTVSRWRLVPEPLARRYRLAPFAVTVLSGAGTDAVREETSFYTSPVVFAPPAARESVTGDMEIAPKRDLPPLSWRLAGIAFASSAAAALLAWLVWLAARKVRMMVKVHRMSPIERALYELEALLKKNLPGRGFYKDFYVELTMVVRRYVERRHSVRAPNLTTDEFLRAMQGNPAFSASAVAELRQFLESADMVKFAGVEATPEMADSATSRARGYLETDNGARSGGAK